MYTEKAKEEDTVGTDQTANCCGKIWLKRLFFVNFWTCVYDTTAKCQVLWISIFSLVKISGTQKPTPKGKVKIRSVYLECLS